MLAVLFGLSLSAQITADAYWEDFSNPPQGWWSVDQPQNNQNWDIDAIFDNNLDICAYAPTTGIGLYSPSITLTATDIANGSLSFYMMSAQSSDEACSSTVHLMVIINGVGKTYDIGTLSSSQGWKLVDVDLSSFDTLNYITSSATVSFCFIHYESTGGAWLVLDDFKIRKRSDAFIMRFDPAEGTGSMPDMVSQTGGEVVMPNNAFTAPSGKVFGLWFASDDNNRDYQMFPGDTVTGMDQDLYVYAIWSKTFTVNYNANGGTGTMAAGTGRQYFTYEVLDNAFTRQGYVFVEWNTSADGTGDSYAEGDEINLTSSETGDLTATSITLYAIWDVDSENPLTYTVHYNANGGTGTMDDEVYTDGEDFYLSDCDFTREGYTFDSWNTNANGNGTSYDAGDLLVISADITLYAIWTSDGDDDPITYTIHYAANGGTGTMTDGIVEAGDYYTVKACSFTRNGYTFLTWNTQADGNGTIFTAGTEFLPTADMTLYATWQANGGGSGEGGGQGGEPETTTFTIHYAANGGSGTMTDGTVDEGDYYTVKACSFTRDGYTFLTWNTQPDGSGSIFTVGTEFLPTANITLYAIWQANGGGSGEGGGQGGETEVTSFTIHYDANGGTGTMADGTVEEGDFYTIKACAFTREGYTFVGWNSRADGTGSTYSAGEEINPGRDFTLYAMWVADETEAINSVDMTSVSVYPNPARGMVRVNGATVSRLELMDLTGRMVRSTEGLNTIDLRELNNGVYMLRIIASEGTAVRRIVKK